MTDFPISRLTHISIWKRLFRAPAALKPAAPDHRDPRRIASRDLGGHLSPRLLRDIGLFNG